jgi:hypothetical protein
MTKARAKSGANQRKRTPDISFPPKIVKPETLCPTEPRELTYVSGEFARIIQPPG